MLPPAPAELPADVPIPALLEAGHFQRAKAAIEQLLAANPDDTQALWLMARAENGLAHYESALKLSDKVLAIDDTRAEYHVTAAAAVGHLAEKASLFKQMGYARRAKKELDATLAIDPQNVDALFGSMLFLYAAPGFLGGDKEKAQAAANALTRIDPARGYLAQTRIARERKDPAAEEDLFGKSLEANPSYYDAKTELAEFYLTRGRSVRDAAETRACEALALDPFRIDAWNALAEVAVANQCWDELMLILGRAAEYVPDDSAPKYFAALAMYKSGMQLTWAGDLVRAYLDGPREGDGLLDVAMRLVKDLR